MAQKGHTKTPPSFHFQKLPLGQDAGPKTLPSGPVLVQSTAKAGLPYWIKGGSLREKVCAKKEQPRKSHGPATAVGGSRGHGLNL